MKTVQICSADRNRQWNKEPVYKVDVYRNHQKKVIALPAEATALGDLNVQIDVDT